jgi:hypothetical protein
MTDATQPRMARGTRLSAGILAGALFALLAFAPFASAASDPVASGTTTITFKNGFVKKLKKSGVKIQKLSPTTLKGNKATFTVSGGELDPATGLGIVNLSGGIQFKAGKKKAPVKSLVLDTSKKTLSGNVAGKKLKLATVSAATATRNGFGVNISIKSMKLTGPAAKQLNKKLGFSSKSKKKNKRAAASKAKSLPFNANQVIGSVSGETQPTTVVVKASGDATLALSAAALEKLGKIGPEIPPLSGNFPFAVALSPVAPTTVANPGPPPTVAFPISGGTMGPTATAGTLQTLGGLKLEQNLEGAPPPGTHGVTTLILGNVWVDLGTKQASVEVTVTNPKTPEANLGNLGRVSIADISLTGATVTADPTAHTVSVQNASATLQAVTAATLNSVFVEPVEGKGKGTFAAGDPLGTFSFTAQTE